MKEAKKEKESQKLKLEVLKMGEALRQFKTNAKKPLSPEDAATRDSLRAAFDEGKKKLHDMRVSEVAAREVETK